MEQYSYEEFLEDLSMGREIHFIYKNDNYYIGCGTGQFMFWKSYDSTSEIVGDGLEDLLRKVRLDGKQIKEIWDLIEIDTIF
ncbi:hypothetical protein [Bacillus sp. AFS088145]|uniref:hypothetical protein n=1 Tax=Bacillus sp. AFS088145 TaxID=2033514 RepID=UPI000BF8FBA2|nr:hypothetical protein [Bacillus sp. AFS088145]PFH88709.1 hypothetical protein COI44_08120 [Bacillus sp. AFS088145]